MNLHTDSDIEPSVEEIAQLLENNCPNCSAYIGKYQGLTITNKSGDTCECKCSFVSKVSKFSHQYLSMSKMDEWYWMKIPLFY